MNRNGTALATDMSLVCVSVLFRSDEEAVAWVPRGGVGRSNRPCGVCRTGSSVALSGEWQERSCLVCRPGIKMWWINKADIVMIFLFKSIGRLLILREIAGHQWQNRGQRRNHQHGKYDLQYKSPQEIQCRMLLDSHWDNGKTAGMDSFFFCALAPRLTK